MHAQPPLPPQLGVAYPEERQIARCFDFITNAALAGLCLVGGTGIRLKPGAGGRGWGAEDGAGMRPGEGVDTAGCLRVPLFQMEGGGGWGPEAPCCAGA